MATTALPGSAAPTPPPTLGDIRDVGSVRRETLHAFSYTVLGTAKVLGDVTVGRGDVQGFATIGGRLTADQFRSDGALEVLGNVAVKGELQLRGSTAVGGTVSAGDLRVAGGLRVTGAVTVDGPARFHGHLETPATLTARSLTFDGGIDVAGVVESATIVGRLRRPSRIGEIRSQHVRIVRPPILAGRGSLRVDRIEAVEVELSGVSCEYLRAERVRLGRDAQVTRLEGTLVRRHSSAVVGPVSREPAPFGMSR